MLLLFSLFYCSPAWADEQKAGSELPAINVTIMGFGERGTDRTYAIGPHDSALVLERFEGKYKVVGEIGGGIYHLMGQEADLAKIKYFEAYGLTDDDVNQFHKTRREAIQKYKEDQISLESENRTDKEPLLSESDCRTPGRQTETKGKAESPDYDDEDSGTWRAVAVKVNTEWEAKHNRATEIAINIDRDGSDAAVDSARADLMKLAADSRKFSKWETAASLNNAANILYMQRRYKEASALYRRALARVENGSDDFISPVPGKIKSNSWKASRASRMNDATEKPIPVMWIKPGDVNHAQQYFRAF
jgi:hypothetical protein